MLIVSDANALHLGNEISGARDIRFVDAERAYIAAFVG